MKNKIIYTVVGLGLFMSGIKAQSAFNIIHIDQLVKVGPYEWIDPSRISYFKHSYTIDLTGIGGDSKFPIDSRLIVDGAVVAPSSDTEEAITKVLNSR